MLQIRTYLCTGCGACVDTCPFGALSIKNGVAVVDNDACRLCGVCVDGCSFGAIAMTAEQPAADPASSRFTFPPPLDFQSGAGVGRGGGMGRGVRRGMGGGRGGGMHRGGGGRG